MLKYAGSLNQFFLFLIVFRRWISVNVVFRLLDLKIYAHIYFCIYLGFTPIVFKHIRKNKRENIVCVPPGSCLFLWVTHENFMLLFGRTVCVWGICIAWKTQLEKAVAVFSCFIHLKDCNKKRALISLWHWRERRYSTGKSVKVRSLWVVWESLATLDGKDRAFLSVWSTFAGALHHQQSH